MRPDTREAIHEFYDTTQAEMTAAGARGMQDAHELAQALTILALFASAYAQSLKLQNAGHTANAERQLHQSRRMLDRVIREFGL